MGLYTSRVAEGTSQEIRLPLGQGIVGHVGSTGERLNIPDAYQDPRFDRSFDLASGYRTRELLAVPVVGQVTGRVIGVIQVGAPLLYCTVICCTVLGCAVRYCALLWGVEW